MIQRKLQDVSHTLLKGESLNKQNAYIQRVLEQHSIKADVQFKPERLQEFINQNKTFGKGLMAYLKSLEEQLDSALTNYQHLKLPILQILAELGGLVFPNTSACYSLLGSEKITMAIDCF